MINNLTSDIINNYSYLKVYLVVTGYFLFLYFAIAPIFLLSCKRLAALGLLERISDNPTTKKQIRFEIKHSIKSILIFGFSSIPLLWLIRNDFISLADNNLINGLIGLLILTIWNEVHFFLVHRLMHIPYFMRKVHYIHHHSITPSVYSVYSFHWLEAFLLSTVPLTILPFINLSPAAIFLFPLVSILLNYAGHCNYRFGHGKGPKWTRFGSKHHAHHHEFLPQYGFASGLMDSLFHKFRTKNNQPKQ